MPSDPDSDTLALWRGFLRDMTLIRRFEEKAGQLYGMGLVGGYCHLSIGQEAVAVGLGAALRKGDTRVAAFRAHGHMLAAGMDPARMLAEMLGRATGYSGGKGGALHMAAPEHGFYGGHGLSGMAGPIGTGLAFAERYRRTHNVTMCAFGDGAAHHGQIAESYELARTWSLPVLFVIENNALAPGQDRTPKGQRLMDRAAAQGIPGRVVDGMDVVAVHAAARDVLLEVRAGKGPRLLEMQTYRYRGHALADAEPHRTLDEMRRVRAERDPLERLRQRLREAGDSEAALKDCDTEAKARVADAAETARAASEPAAAALFTHITPGG